MIRVLFICHGNICRSTMAESIMTYLVKQAGVEDQFYINSAATSCEEIGNPPHSGTVAKLKAEGIPVIPHRAVFQLLSQNEQRNAYHRHQAELAEPIHLLGQIGRASCRERV